jgi:hypothetical protein
MPPKGRRRQAFGGEEIGGDTASEDTQYTPTHPPVEEMEHTPTRAGALRRTPPTTAIRGGEEPQQQRRLDPGAGPVPFRGFDTAAAGAEEGYQDDTEAESALEAGGAQGHHAPEWGPAAVPSRRRQAPMTPAVVVPASEERFFDILKVIGTKMNIHLKGSENFFEWHQKLQKLLLRLKCTGVLTNEGSELVEYKLWQQMEGTVEDIIINSIPQNLRVEMAKLRPFEMIHCLRERFEKKGCTAVTTAAIELIDLNQANMSIADYINKFEGLRSACAVTGAAYTATVEVPALVKGLTRRYREKAYEELNRQANKFDIEALKQALFRAEAFDNEQKRLNQGQQQQQSFQRGRGGRGQAQPHSNSFRGRGQALPHSNSFGTLRCNICGNSGHLEASCHQRGQGPGPGIGAGADGGIGMFSEEEETVQSSGGAHSAQEGIDSDWLLDSGASLHMTGSKKGIEEIVPVKKSITIANGQRLTAMWKGTVRVEGIDIKDVYVVPGLQLSLISVGQLVEAGWRVRFDDAGAEISCGGDIYMVEKQNGLFSRLNCRRQNEPNLNRQSGAVLKKDAEIEESASKQAKSLPGMSERLLYARMGHMNGEYLSWLPEAVEDEFRLVRTKKAFCEPCVLGKQHRQPNRRILPARALCPG